MIRINRATWAEENPFSVEAASFSPKHLACALSPLIVFAVIVIAFVGLLRKPDFVLSTFERLLWI